MTHNTRKNRKTIFDLAMLQVIFTLAWPTMLEELMQTAVQYIDTAMVGALGTDATAAVGATGTVNWLVMGGLSAIGIGFLSPIAQAFGAGEQQKARKIAAQAVSVTAIVGLVLTALMLGISGVIPAWMQVEQRLRALTGTYFMIVYIPILFRAATIIFGTILRAVGDTRTPMRIGITVNVINIILNLLLIYPARTLTIAAVQIPIWGAGLGVVGAASASACSYFAGGILMTFALWHHREISPGGLSLVPDWKVLRPVVRIAIPNLLQRVGTSMGYVVFAAMINALGGISTAAHTIANTVESAFYIPGWGMQAAAATLSGNAYGARDEQRLKSLGSTIIPMEVVLMCITGGLLFVLAEPLVRIFSQDAQVIALGTTVLRMVAVSEPFYGVPIVVEGLMLGVGKTTTPLIYNLLGMWCVRILGTFLCTKLLGMGLVSAWACMIGHNLLLFFLFGGHYLTGRWYPPLNLKKG